MVPAKSHQEKFYNPSQDDDIFARTYGQDQNSKTQSTKQSSDGFFSPADERQIHGAGNYNLEALEDISELQMVDNFQETE